MRKMIVAAAVACALGAYAEDRTVTDAAGVVAALQALNGTGGTIYLETGDYDVGTYDYGGYWNSNAKFVTTNGIGHLALYNVTLIGKSDNPRDTVIYGNRTKSVVRSHLGKMQNLTVSNGCISVYNVGGGGVGSTTRSSIFSNVVVTCCSANNSSKGNGGAIDAGTWYDCTIISNSTVNGGGGIVGGTLYNCNVISNYATTGGGCYYGTQLHDCKVLYNTAGNGGGVGTSSAAAATPCHVYGGLIVGNKAANGGGAYYACLYGGTVVSNNTATTGSGGGIYSGHNRFASNTVIACNTAANNIGGGAAGVILVGCEIFNNRSKNGGGVSGSVCESCTITDNTASQNGGGGNTGSYTNCVISGNSAASEGGGLYTFSKAVDCRIYGNTAADGGGCAGTNAYYIGCTISNNVATGTHGGGGYKGTYTNCLIACNSLLSTSTRSVTGGGLCSGVAVGCTIVSNCVGTLSNEANSSAYGGGAASSEVIDSIVGYNQTTGGVENANGGGLYSGSASNCLIVGNAAWGARQNQGGGAQGSALTNCIVRNNLASIGTGLNYGSVYGCLFSNNVSMTSAAANTLRRPSSVENSEVVGTCMMACWASNCRFVNFTNGAYLAEGENIHVSGYIPGVTSPTMLSTGVSLTNCLFANNICGSGSILFAGSATKGVDLVNCTIADNVLNYTCYGTTNGTPGVMENCIFVGNKASDGTSRNLWYPAAHNGLWLSNCLIGSGRASSAPVFEVGTITNDNARFVKDGSRDAYALKRSSPAIGKGLVQDWMTDALDVRLDPAFPRLKDGLVDIGCYQCWLDPIGFTFSVR